MKRYVCIAIIILFFVTLISPKHSFAQQSLPKQDTPGTLSINDLAQLSHELIELYNAEKIDEAILIGNQILNAKPSRYRLVMTLMQLALLHKAKLIKLTDANDKTSSSEILLEEVQRNLKQAITFFQQGLIAQEVVQGKESAAEAGMRSEIAKLHIMEKDFTSAEKELLLALAIREKLFDKQSKEVMFPKSNMR